MFKLSRPALATTLILALLLIVATQTSGQAPSRRPTLAQPSSALDTRIGGTQVKLYTGSNPSPRFWDAPVHSTAVDFVEGERLVEQATFPGPEDVVRLIVQLRDEPLSVRMRQAKLNLLGASEASVAQAYADHLSAVRREVLTQMEQQGIQAQVNREFEFLFNGLAVSVKMKEWPRLSQLPQVQAVEPDYAVQADLQDSVPLIGAPSVWAMSDGTGRPVTGQGVRVAVLDTGIDYTHPDLGGCLGPTCKVIGGYDLVNNDNDPMDDNGHGTHVAGIVAANGTLKGVAPGASLMAFKALDDRGSGWNSTIIAGLERAADPDSNPTTDDGAQVINLSLGGAGTPDGPMSQAVDHAVEQGIVVVAAAGNSGPTPEMVGSPGVARKALTVAASDKYDYLADFSSRGPVPGYPDLIKPDLTAPGVSITSTVPYYGNLGSPSRYRNLDGTSMAAPHVAGSAALLKQLYPTWTPEVIKASLINTAKDLGRDMFEQGTGRVDVYAAATARATLAPGSLALGADDLSQSVWLVSGTLTLTNWSASASTWSLALSHALPAGVTASLSASNVTLTPGESRVLTLSLSVDNRRYKK